MAMTPEYTRTNPPHICRSMFTYTQNNQKYTSKVHLWSGRRTKSCILKDKKMTVNKSVWLKYFQKRSGVGLHVWKHKKGGRGG